MSFLRYTPSESFREKEIARLERLYHDTDDIESRTAFQAILFTQQGLSNEEITRLTLLDETSLEVYQKQYEANQFGKLKLYSPEFGRICLQLALLLYVAAVVITHDEPEFKLRGLTFCLWIAAIPIAYLGLCHLEYKPRLKDNKTFCFERSEILTFVGLTLAAFATRFLFLDVYPFQPIHDGMRDTGLDGVRIATNELKNIYGWGYTDAQGLIIPTISSFLFPVFGYSPMIFLVPAALISSLDVLLLYLTARRYLGRGGATWAAVILLTLPLHLFYGRTELVIIFSSFWATAILYLMSHLLEKRSIKNYGQLGLLLGFTAAFHAGIKVVVILTIGLVFLISLYFFWKRKERKAIASGLGLMLLFILVSFGPRILFSPPEVFLQLSKVNITAPPPEEEKPASVEIPGLFTLKLPSALNDYPKSFMIYIFEAAASHNLASLLPILSLPLAILFVIGLLLSFAQGSAWVKTPWLKLVSIYILILPFTNSSITNFLNQDYRFAPVYPMLSLLVAYGTIEILKRIGLSSFYRRVVYGGLVALLLVTTSYSAFWFFDSDMATYTMFRGDKQLIYQDFVLAYSIRTIKSEPSLQKSDAVCLTASRSLKEWLSLDHIQQQFEFYLPNKKIDLHLAEQDLTNNQLYISPACSLDLTQSQWQVKEYCSNYEKFICPPRTNSSFKLYTELAAKSN